MRVIYKLWIILIFAGVITAWAGPTLSVTLDKTAPYDGATRKNETISTKARVQSYTNDNLQEELDQGGYVEYKYYFEYSSGQGGMVFTPTPNPTVFIDSKTCNTSGCFSGPLGSGWIRVTVTAHTCDRDGNEIPGSLTSDVASTRITVVEITPISIDASIPNNAKSNYQTDPFSCTINEVKFAAPGTTDEDDVPGNFYFTFDQNDLPQGNSSIILDYLGDSITVTADRTQKITAQSQKSVLAYFTVEGVGLRAYGHKLCEIYHQVFYSKAYSGKTLWVGTSLSGLYIGLTDWEHINGWGETHHYIWTGGSTNSQDMIEEYDDPYYGNPYTLYRECSASLWPVANGLTGIATVADLFYEGTPATFIFNANVDRSIP